MHGVLAADMVRHCQGEDLKIGANLTWGLGFDFQKQFFTEKEDDVSNYPYILRYDVEVSGFVFKDRLVTTFGLRWDQRYSRPGATPLWNYGITMDEASFHRWNDGDWLVGTGKTTTAGAVLKPLSWFSLHANKSNSFVPAEVGYDLYRNILPGPTGEGHDYGFRLNLIGNKLAVRVNRYKTQQINARNGVSAAAAQRVRRIDFTSASTGQMPLQTQATAWLAAAAQAGASRLPMPSSNNKWPTSWVCR